MIAATDLMMSTVLWWELVVLFLIGFVLIVIEMRGKE